MWVQVLGLPFDLLSEEVGKDIGNGLGKVVEVDLKAFSSYQACFLRVRVELPLEARFLRVRVELPLDKLLRRGGVVASPKGDTVCIGFKYERLVALCFKCGRIGHEARFCSFHDDHHHELPYGEWMKAGFHKTNTSANNGGSFVNREINAQVRPSRGRMSMPSVRENANSDIDTVGVVFGQDHREVVREVFVGGPFKGSVVVEPVAKAGTIITVGPSKGGVGFEPVAKAGTIATTTEKLTPDFEVIISELDQAIQSEPTILISNFICEEQLLDKSNFSSDLVDIEVMDANLTLCKRVSSGKEVVTCDASCLQGDVCGFNASNVSGTNLFRGRPKRSGFKIKSGSHTLQGPSACGSNGVIAKKLTSKAGNSSSVELDGLKKGTWKRACTKSRPSSLLAPNNVLSAKRSGKEISRETEKSELAQKKTKVSINKGLYIHSGED